MKYEKPEVRAASALAVIAGHKQDPSLYEVAPIPQFTTNAYEADE